MAVLIGGSEASIQQIACLSAWQSSWIVAFQLHQVYADWDAVISSPKSIPGKPIDQSKRSSDQREALI
jgi:hypothetical protein